jgi:hypothetical protein
VVGGNGERVLERVVRYGDEWMPNRVGDDDALLARVDELQRLAGEAGRGAIPVTVYGASRKPERLERWAAGGVTRAVYWLPSADAGEVERALDECAGYVAAFRDAGG